MIPHQYNHITMNVEATDDQLYVCVYVYVGAKCLAQLALDCQGASYAARLISAIC